MNGVPDKHGLRVAEAIIKMNDCILHTDDGALTDAWSSLVGALSAPSTVEPSIEQMPKDAVIRMICVAAEWDYGYPDRRAQASKLYHDIVRAQSAPVSATQTIPVELAEAVRVYCARIGQASPAEKDELHSELGAFIALNVRHFARSDGKAHG